jgi:hypothetical protein
VGLPGAPGGYPGPVEVDKLGGMALLFLGGAGGSQGALRDDSSCPVNC